MRLLTVLALALSAAVASAQPVWRPHAPGPSVSLDVLKPVGEGGIDFTDENGTPLGEGRVSLFQSAQILTARVPVGGRVVVVGEVPFAYASYAVPDGVEEALGFEVDAGDVGVGNPYVGAEVAVSRELTVGGGVRLPLASGGDGAFSSSLFTGLVADFERPEAFLAHVASATLGVRVARQVTPAVAVRLDLAPTLAVDTRGSVDVTADDEDNPQDLDPAVWARYGLQIVAAAGPLVLHGGIVGRQRVANDRYSSFSTTTSALLGAVAVGLPVQPGVLVRVPLRWEFRPDPVVGLSLTVPVR